jgi:hypothetical protein
MGAILFKPSAQRLQLVKLSATCIPTVQQKRSSFFKSLTAARNNFDRSFSEIFDVETAVGSESWPV